MRWTSRRKTFLKFWKSDQRTLSTKLDYLKLLQIWVKLIFWKLPKSLTHQPTFSTQLTISVRFKKILFQKQFENFEKTHLQSNFLLQCITNATSEKRVESKRTENCEFVQLYLTKSAVKWNHFFWWRKKVHNHLQVPHLPSTWQFVYFEASCNTTLFVSFFFHFLQTRPGRRIQLRYFLGE